jgi:NAD(P)-dependent dehydrogenase (short-subunit alcohol dehydrogenase family)
MNVLITGASSGIGEGCARWLDARGHRVFAGVRRSEDGERLRIGASERLTPVLLDVTDAGSIEAARAGIEGLLGTDGMDGLVNNAGIAVAGPMEHVEIAALRRQLEVNVVGQVAVMQSFLPLIRRVRGRIVFIGSLSGRISNPFLAPYCASKFALEAIADACRIELRPWGIHVALLEPGSIATPIWNKPVDAGVAADPARAEAIERDYGPAVAAFQRLAAAIGSRGVSTDVVSAVIEQALTERRPKARYAVGTDARLQLAVVPFLGDRVRDFLVRRVMKLPADPPR